MSLDRRRRATWLNAPELSIQLAPLEFFLTTAACGSAVGRDGVSLCTEALRNFRGVMIRFFVAVFFGALISRARAFSTFGDGAMERSRLFMRGGLIFAAKGSGKLYDSLGMSDIWVSFV